jgi:hypothetical protein
MKNIHNFTAKTMNTHSVDWQDLVTVSDIHEQMDVESFYIRSEDKKSSTCSGTSHMLCFFFSKLTMQSMLKVKLRWESQFPPHHSRARALGIFIMPVEIQK